MLAKIRKLVLLEGNLNKRPGEERIQELNSLIFNRLETLANTNDFSKIKMGFNDRCPRKVESCQISSCMVNGMSLSDNDGYIDLKKIKESYSPGVRNSSRIWNDMYGIVKDDTLLTNILSGLHTSVSTHISLFHTKIFNSYFSHPVLYQSWFRPEYKDNLHLLYSVITIAVANLGTNTGTVEQDAIEFAHFLKEKLVSVDLKNKFNKEVETGKSLNELHNLSKYSIEENFKLILKRSPKISKEAISKINDFVRNISCLNCEKCKLWGTIQTKGIKAAIKVLNGMPLYKNEAIFLINLLRRLSTSIKYGPRLETRIAPHLNLLFICHKQIGIITVTLGSVLLLYLKLSRKKKTGLYKVIEEEEL